MYTPRERMFYVKCKCDPGARPSPDAEDKAAELKLSGGFNVLKKNICPVCNEAKSKNGSCSCP
jgi:hypothetical protein